MQPLPVQVVARLSTMGVLPVAVIAGSAAMDESTAAPCL